MSHPWNTLCIILYCCNVVMLPRKYNVMGKCVPSLCYQSVPTTCSNVNAASLKSKVSPSSCFSQDASPEKRHARRVSFLGRYRKTSRANLEHCSVFFFVFFFFDKIIHFLHRVFPIHWILHNVILFFSLLCCPFSSLSFRFSSFPLFSTRVFRYRNCDLYDETAKIE